MGSTKQSNNFRAAERMSSFDSGFKAAARARERMVGKGSSSLAEIVDIISNANRRSVAMKIYHDLMWCSKN